MASEALVSDSVDPLSVLNGPSLFPRTIRASADAQVPVDCKDLDSIHNFMKSLELRSPEKLMNEAKKIVDGGAELLESHFASFAGGKGISTAVPAKAKDRPQERRPGLGIARKRAPFSLRTTTSQPSVTLEKTSNIDNLQDPDEFFDAYERTENAKKEIQRQLGGSIDNLNFYEPSKNARPRRQGILGKTYNYKHRYSSTPSENDDLLMLSQDTVDQDHPSAPNDESLEELAIPNLDVDIEDEELAVPIKKIENEVGGILEELLSHNNEDLEGDGAFNLLQDWLNIKPLDKENLYVSQLTDVGKNIASTVAESVQRSRKSSFMIDKVKESLNRKTPTEHELANQISSPTPPRSPFASLFLLKTKILQPSPLKDPFSPMDDDLCAPRNVSPCQHKDVLHEHVDAPEGLDISIEFESHVDVDNTDPTVSNMDVQAIMGNADSLPDQGGDESVSTRSTLNPVSSTTHPRSPFPSTSLLKKKILQPNPLRNLFPPVDVDLVSCRNASPGQPKDKLIQQLNSSKDLGISSLDSQIEVDNEEPGVSNMDVQEVVRDEGSHPEQFLDDNISVRSRTDCRPHEESDNNIEKTMSTNEMADEPYPSVLDNKAPDEATSRKQTHPAKQSKENQNKPLRGKRGAVESRIRKSHPMRKSLAESGTSFDTGVRRSKRIKMRPLEYWKGERFLYGHVDDSLKLLGVKYISPGKGNENLKVKPYILSESSKYKELLDLAARH